MNQLTKFLTDAAESGYDVHDDIPRFAYYLDALGYNWEDLDMSDIQALSRVEQEHFLGQYESPADFTEESLRNAYGHEIDALPDIIRNNIDWALIWDRDYRHDCLTVEVNDPENWHYLIWHAH